MNVYSPPIHMMPSPPEYFEIFSNPARCFSNPARCFSNPARCFSNPARCFSNPARCFSLLELQKFRSHPQNFYVYVRTYNSPNSCRKSDSTESKMNAHVTCSILVHFVLEHTLVKYPYLLQFIVIPHKRICRH